MADQLGRYWVWEVDLGSWSVWGSTVSYNIALPLLTLYAWIFCFQDKLFWFWRFNGTGMLERLKNKKVIGVGHSLNKIQWESLACLLYSTTSRAHFNVPSAVYKVFQALVRKNSIILCFFFVLTVEDEYKNIYLAIAAL